MKQFLLSFCLLAIPLQGEWHISPKVGVMEATVSYEQDLQVPAFIVAPIARRWDAKQCGGTFGGVCGYTFTNCCPLELGIEAGGFYNNGSADYAWSYFATGNPYVMRTVLRGNVEASLCPGYRISRGFLAYLKGGYSLGFAQQRLQVVNEDPPFATINQKEAHRTLNGYLFGGGAKACLCGQLYLIGELNFYGYLTDLDASIFSPAVGFGDLPGQLASTMNIPWVRSLTLGASYQF